ncbi:MAG: TM2 domain-containing protein [Deltaproteobacteria bacterium]|jgi:hypothetical protein|nr:TM2 domain-containing protein [Deltaproteobacteria bacterium]
MSNCSSCGAPTNPTDINCPSCGQPQAAQGGQGGQPYGGQPYANQPYGGQPYPGQPYPGQPYPGQPFYDPYQSPLSKTVALLLCWYLGALGVHRFYAGKILTGVIMFLTGGAFGIWIIVDFILICLNQFTDAEGRLVNKPCNLLVVILAIALPTILFVILIFIFVGYYFAAVNPRLGV